jgi:uncharacterized protein (TIGR02246 family)
MSALALAALFGIASATPRSTPPPGKEAVMSVPKDEASVRAALKAFADAVSREDYAAVLDMITDDAVFWTANYPEMKGKAALKAAYEGLAAYRVHQEFEIEELQVCGEWAFVRGYENFTLDPKDGKGQRLEIKHRRAISILRRQPDGAWKTARGMTNYDAPQPGAATQ